MPLQSTLTGVATKIPFGVDAVTNALFRELSHGTWTIKTVWAARLTTLFWPQLISMPLSASRIPPEMEWLKAMENKPSLILSPQLMKQLHILQSGEDYHVVYCLAMKCEPKRIERIIRHHLENMRRAYELEVYALLNPIPANPTESTTPGNVVDRLSVRRHLHKQDPLPKWARLEE